MKKSRPRIRGRLGVSLCTHQRVCQQLAAAKNHESPFHNLVDGHHLARLAAAVDGEPVEVGARRDALARGRSSDPTGRCARRRAPASARSRCRTQAPVTSKTSAETALALSSSRKRKAVASANGLGWFCDRVITEPGAGPSTAMLLWMMTMSLCWRGTSR